jgi:cold shock CspA family protein
MITNGMPVERLEEGVDVEFEVVAQPVNRAAMNTRGRAVVRVVMR